jgi:hypothetical protein
VQDLRVGCGLAVVAFSGLAIGGIPLLARLASPAFDQLYAIGAVVILP